MNANYSIVDDPFTRSYVRLKARQLIGRYGFRASDLPDLQQELFLVVAQKRRYFDPDRVSKEAFVTRVVNHRVASLVRYKTRPCRDPGQTLTSLSDIVGLAEDDHPIERDQQVAPEDDLRVDRRSFCEQRRIVDLLLDLEESLKLLPPDVTRLVLLLIDHSPTDAARELGISRATVANWLAALRAAIGNTN